MNMGKHTHTLTHTLAYTHTVTVSAILIISKWLSEWMIFYLHTKLYIHKHLTGT